MKKNFRQKLKIRKKLLFYEENAEYWKPPVQNETGTSLSQNTSLITSDIGRRLNKMCNVGFSNEVTTPPRQIPSLTSNKNSSVTASSEESIVQLYPECTLITPSNSKFQSVDFNIDLDPKVAEWIPIRSVHSPLTSYVSELIPDGHTVSDVENEYDEGCPLNFIDKTPSENVEMTGCYNDSDALLVNQPKEDASKSPSLNIPIRSVHSPLTSYVSELIPDGHTVSDVENEYDEGCPLNFIDKTPSENVEMTGCYNESDTVLVNQPLDSPKEDKSPSLNIPIRIVHSPLTSYVSELIPDGHTVSNVENEYDEGCPLNFIDETPSENVEMTGCYNESDTVLVNQPLDSPKEDNSPSLNIPIRSAPLTSYVGELIPDGHTVSNVENEYDCEKDCSLNFIVEMPSEHVEMTGCFNETDTLPINQPLDSPKEDAPKPPSLNVIYEDTPVLLENTVTNGRKKNACFFCNELIVCSNYSRHLIRKHKNETEVTRLNSLPCGSKERRDILSDLRNKGNYMFNADDHSSSFVPARRPLKDQSPKKKDFVSCSYCLVFVKRKNFFLHRKICKKYEKNIIQCKYCDKKMSEGYLVKHLKNTCDKKEDFINDTKKDQKTSRRQVRVLQSSSIFVYENLPGATNDLIKNILPLMKIDEISELVKRDPLILKVGSKLRSNHKEDHLKTHITSKMRDLAKVLNIMKSINGNIRGLKDCLKAENVQILFKAIQLLCGYDEDTGSVKIPSMSGRLKGTLSLALQTLKNDIRSDPNISFDTKKEIVFDYQTTADIVQADWRFIISTNAQKSQNEQHRSKGLLMPTEEDIKTASSYLTKKEEEMYKTLKYTADPNSFEKLCEALIADLIIFNCRRSGEVARARLSDYLNRDKIEFDGKLESVLSRSELSALESLTIFQVPGKRDRTVPILLTGSMKKCIDLLVAMRGQLKVGSETLLFPRLYSDRPYDPCKILRELKQNVSLKKPNHFTSTGFRHELATRSHIEDTDKPGYKKVLFSHMGHKEQIHNDKYVLPLPILQVSRVGANLLERRSSSSSKQQSQNVDINECSTERQADENLTKNQDYNSKQLEEDPDFNLSDYSSDEKKTPKKKKKVVRTPWTFEQQKLVTTHFKEFFSSKSTPGRLRCLDLISKNDSLKGRTWQQINAFIENVNKHRKKLPLELVAVINT